MLGRRTWWVEVWRKFRTRMHRGHREKAKKLKELAMSLKDTPNLWDYYSYEIILKKMGDKKEALKNIEQSLKLAIETNNNYLIVENKKIIGRITGKINCGNKRIKKLCAPCVSVFNNSWLLHALLVDTYASSNA